jgi:hypothetical protein
MGNRLHHFRLIGSGKKKEETRRFNRKIQRVIDPGRPINAATADGEDHHGPLRAPLPLGRDSSTYQAQEIQRTAWLEMIMASRLPGLARQASVSLVG